MFGTAKPAASLSSGLLARKGQARPAMRPQGLIGLDPGTVLEDLGWNDMGVHDPVPPVLAQRHALADEFSPPAHMIAPEPVPEVVSEPVAAVTPAVETDEDDATSASLTQITVRRRVTTATAARIGREVAARRAPKAAFTLRLDPDRHLKLRLAAAVTGQSAQALMTHALDDFLTSLPEVDSLVDHLAPGTGR